MTILVNSVVSGRWWWCRKERECDKYSKNADDAKKDYMRDALVAWEGRLWRLWRRRL